MWSNFVVVFCWVIAVNCYNFDNLDNLGERISAQVAAQIQPLEGLGDRISAQVGQSVGSVQVRSSFFEPPVHALPLRRSAVDLNNRLSELDGLGDRINQNVYDSLEPVRAIDLNFKIKDGVGGITIVTYRPSGTQHLIKNYQIFTCSGRINEGNGECPGRLTRFEISESSPRSEWCFLRSYSVVNNQVCLSTGSVSISSYNDHISCKGSDNKPTLLMSLKQYKRMCSSVSETAEYIYIPNENDPAHVAIPNENRYVKCENRQKNYCTFKERNGIFDINTYGSGGNTIIVQNRGSGVTYF